MTRVDGEPLGEEPRRSIEKDLKISRSSSQGPLLFGVVRWDSSSYQVLWPGQGSKQWHLTKTSKRSEGQSVLEYDLSNKDESRFSFTFH